MAPEHSRKGTPTVPFNPGPQQKRKVSVGVTKAESEFCKIIHVRPTISLRTKKHWRRDSLVANLLTGTIMDFYWQTRAKVEATEPEAFLFLLWCLVSSSRTTLSTSVKSWNEWRLRCRIKVTGLCGRKWESTAEEKCVGGCSYLGIYIQLPGRQMNSTIYG